ncbi:MAG: helix-turn-helix domain-containing protein [Deltaproteobacteria bacterium]|nr:helix-turn-helix domain-containing protein [Deltaproteobacteria bacterium]
MSQAELAEAADLSVQFVAALEQESRSATLKSVDKLSGALGVTTSQLFAAGEAKRKKRSAVDQIAALLDGLTTRQQGHIINAVKEMRKLVGRRG